jgi:hypothetical protein
MLLKDLPAELRRQVGQLLTAAGERAEQDSEHTYADLLELTRIRHPVLDSFPNRPVVGVNLQAPQRVIGQAVEEMVRQWKEEQGIPERRRRDDKLEEYLAVWDKREGWVGDHYDVDREQTLRQIAQELTMSLSTVANQYRSAFRLVVGHEYKPERWGRVLGIWKLSDWTGPDKRAKRASRRPWRSRQARPVAESVLRPPEYDKGVNPILNTAGASSDEVECAELLMDIRGLIQLGRSNSEIATELALSPSTADGLIDYFRQRQEDML